MPRIIAQSFFTILLSLFLLSSSLSVSHLCCFFFTAPPFSPPFCYCRLASSTGPPFLGPDCWPVSLAPIWKTLQKHSDWSTVGWVLPLTQSTVAGSPNTLAQLSQVFVSFICSSISCGLCCTAQAQPLAAIFPAFIERETRNPPQFMFAHRPFLYSASCSCFTVDSLITHHSLLSVINLEVPSADPSQLISLNS